MTGPAEMLWGLLTAAGSTLALSLIVCIALGICSLTLLFFGSAVVALEQFARSARFGVTLVLLGAAWSLVVGYAAVETFVNDEIEGLFGHPKLPHGELHALWDLANELPLPPNPYRAADGSLTEAARRGRALFNGKADCRSCHSGEQFGGTGKSAAVGTTPAGRQLDVPHLTGVYDSAPYLHDGRADTLESIFTRHNASRAHGKAHVLTEAESQDLIQFLREL